LIQPRWAWAVFGPYVNRNHYAGHVALALPLAFAAAFAALERLRAEIRRTQRGWLLLAEREGSLLIWHLVLAGFLVAGLVASRSRGGAAAFLAAAALLLVTRRQHGLLTLGVGLVTLAAAVWAWRCRRRLGGMTGDTLGAAVEMTAMVVLLVGLAYR
jgi:cobalamin synthase